MTTRKFNLGQLNLGVELTLAVALLLIGLLALPAIVFVVGKKLFGTYSTHGGLGLFYSNFTSDLANAKVASWAIALGPLLLIVIVRLIIGGRFSFGGKQSNAGTKTDRIEPSIRS